jgi:MATE family multidrug resistance protein
LKLLRKIFRGRLSGKVIDLAYPVMLAMFTQTFINLVDTAMVGHIGKEGAISGMIIGVMSFWIVGGGLSSISVGTQALTSRRFGEKKDGECGKVLFNSLVVAVAAGIVSTALFAGLAAHIFPLLSNDPAVVYHGTGFATYRFLGLLPLLPVYSLKSFFDGIGRTKVFMVTAIIMNTFNVALNYALIFGEFGMPRLEVMGAGLAASISSAIGLGILFVISLKPSTMRRFGYYRLSNLDFSVMKSIVSISYPSGIAVVFTTAGFLAFYWIVGRVGTLEQDVSGILINLGSLTFMPVIGFGIASATLIGQSLGARRMRLSKAFGYEAVKLGQVVLMTMGAVLMAFPEAIVGVFSSDPRLAAACAGPARILGAVQFFEAPAIIFAQSLLGAGDTRYVMAADVLLHWVFLIPLAYVVAVPLGFGVIGAWTMMLIYVALLALAMGLRFRGGKWQGIKI